jgi:hypothetical protein
MPRSSCIHRTFPPSGPLDGARRCSLEESTLGPPPESSRSSFSTQWCCRSCLLPAAVGGARPRGGWCSSAIARLQGFSSCSPAAISRQWSSRRMSTSLVVERSEPDCGLPPPPPSASRMFIILAGVEGETELGSCLPPGLATRFFLQHSGEKGVHSPCGGGELRLRGASRLQAPSTVACLAPWPRWLWHRLRRCLLPLGRGVAVRPPHGRQSRRAQVRHIHGVSRAAGRTALTSPCGLYKTSYAVGGGDRVLGWSCPHSRGRTGARTSSRALRQPPLPVSYRCRGGRCRRC